MNKKRLTILRDALIEYAKNPGNLKFDLSWWITIPGKHERSDTLEVLRGARAGKNYCGTAACAVGLAASLPEFNKEGLRPGGIGEACVVLAGVTNESSLDAAIVFFDLSRSDAGELFCPGSYDDRDITNPIAVAEKITALLHTA